MRRTLTVLQQDPVLRSLGSFPPLAVTPTVTDLLAAGAPVGIGLSGGKDSGVLAYALTDYLDAIGHTGPRLLLHSDLGLIEWKESLPMCRRIAAHLGLELVVLENDLIARWQKRWQDNVERYRKLACVKLIMPWSSPDLRFCTSEKKIAPLTTALARRFPGEIILNASGIRREESEQRRNAPVCKEQPRLLRKKLHTSGYDWHPLVEWRAEDVFAYHQVRGIPLHLAYWHYGCSRVSCVCCVMSSRENLIHAMRCSENHPVYRILVSLEALSTFSFQSGSWLADIAPHLLDSSLLTAIASAKQRAQRREAAEARLHKHLLYHKGWPQSIPTLDEARLLCEVRCAVAEAVQIPGMLYTRPDEIRDRYAELIAEHRAKEAQKAQQEERRRARELAEVL